MNPDSPKNSSRNAGGSRGRASRGIRHLFRRSEVKFELDIAAATFLRDSIARRLPVFEFAPGYPYTFITTVYFDTADRHFFERARRYYHDNDKIRVKEYYYEEPSSTQAPGSIEGRVSVRYRTSPVAYVELKQRRGELVTKKRLRVPKARLGGILDGDDLGGEQLLGPEAASPDDAGAELPGSHRDARAALGRYLERFSVRATSVISYRRQVFQVDEDELRITFDDRIRIHEPPRDLFGPGFYCRSGEVGALTPASLGVPIRSFSKVITEIKCATGEYPDWLRGALRLHSSKLFSKFTASVRSLSREEPNGNPEGRRFDHGETPLPGRSSPPSLDDTQVFSSPFES